MNQRSPKIGVQGKKLAAYLLAVLLVLVLYLASGALYLGILIIGMVLALALAFVVMAFCGANLKLSVTCQEQGAKGENALYYLRFHNTGKMPVLSLSCQIVMENLLTGEQEEIRELLTLGPGEKKEVETGTLVTHCGCIEGRVEGAYITDPFSIFTKKIAIEGKGSKYVFPRYGEMEVKEEDLNKYDMESYKFSQHQKGNDPSETFAIKTYAPGDSIKSIHWKLSAKMGDIVIKERSLPVENNLIVIVDKCSPCTPDKADMTAEYAACLSYSICKKGIAHSLGWFDSIEKSFKVKEIRNEENFQEALRDFLRSPFGEDKNTTPYHFAEADMEKAWSSYLYVSEDERDIERLGAYGEVSALHPKQN